MKFDESRWQRVKFGDVVRLSTDRCANPAAAGIERFVGLEHIDPADLRIRRWGLVEEGTTFTNHFLPGQVLYGKRRAYQRKVAVAEFEGVCSGDIYVFEPRDEQLLPGLLPFVCQTEAFYEHAVGTSVGSLSPRTNWSHLAEYTFALPPKEHQARAVDLLDAVQSVHEEYSNTLETLDELLAASVASLLDKGDASWPEVRLRDVCERVSVGIAASATHAYRFSGVPFIRNNNIKLGRIDQEDLLYLDPEYDELNRSKRVRTGDVITARTGIPGATAVVPEELDGAQTFTTLISTPKHDELDSSFLSWWINGGPGKQYISSRKGGGVQQNMNATLLQEMPIRLPPVQVQRDIVSKLESIAAQADDLNIRKQHAHRLLALSLQAVFDY